MASYVEHISNKTTFWRKKNYIMWNKKFFSSLLHFMFQLKQGLSIVIQLLCQTLIWAQNRKLIFCKWRWLGGSPRWDAADKRYPRNAHQVLPKNSTPDNISYWYIRLSPEACPQKRKYIEILCIFREVTPLV